MPQQKNPSLFDKRLIERNLRMGLIKRDEYEEFLRKLEDKEAEADHLDVQKMAELLRAASSPLN